MISARAAKRSVAAGVRIAGGEDPKNLDFADE